MSCFADRVACRVAMASSREMPEMSISDAKLPSGMLVMFVATSMPSWPKSFLSVEPEAIKLLPFPGASDSEDSVLASAAS